MRRWNEEIKNKISESNKHAKKDSKPVKELTTGEIFESAFMASRRFNIALAGVINSIASCKPIARGKGYGLKFEFIV